MAKVGENSRDKSRWSLEGMTALVTGGSKGLGSVPLLLPYLCFLLASSMFFFSFQ